MWLAFAFSGPVLWAISIHIDKYLVSRFFQGGSTAVLLIFTGAVGLILLPLIFVLRPVVIELAPAAMAVIAFSGMLYMAAIYFYLRALQAEPVSTVAPFFQAAPLFGYVLGYFVLGERLSPMQMLGGALIVIGGMLLSVAVGSARKFNARMVLLMLACALSLALASLIFKIFALREEFWSATFWAFAGQAVFAAMLLTIVEYRRYLLALLRSNPLAILAFTGSNELINLAGILGARYALLFAPLSLVQAIGSTTALFVFAFSCLLNPFYPELVREDLSRRTLVKNGGATALITAGAVLINF